MYILRRESVSWSLGVIDKLNQYLMNVTPNSAQSRLSARCAASLLWCTHSNKNHVSYITSWNSLCQTDYQVCKWSDRVPALWLGYILCSCWLLLNTIIRTRTPQTPWYIWRSWIHKSYASTANSKCIAVMWGECNMCSANYRPMCLFELNVLLTANSI